MVRWAAERSSGKVVNRLASVDVGRWERINQHCRRWRSGSLI